MRARELNWMQVEEYLARDDRVVLPIGSTEQHGYLSLETDNILAERVSAEGAEPLGMLVLPVLAYGLTPSFSAYPGSPTLRLDTFLAVVRDLLDSLYAQGFRRFLLVNGHGGNVAAGSLVREWAAAHPDAQAIFHSWWSSERVQAAAREVDPEPSHANWFENFPWTRLEGVAFPDVRKPPLDEAAYRVANPDGVRELLGDGVFGGAYELPDEQVEAVWRAGVDEVRELLEHGFR
ncbi:MAG: creatininase family protein [Actinobacteria bacterium]|nr:MAG: creatininase family protein [Actinomycetota bacterium]